MADKIVENNNEENVVVNNNKFYSISESQAKIDNVDYNSIKLPKRATKHSAGYDFFALDNIVIYPGESVKVPTGIKVSLNEDSVLLCFPRSSLGFKYKLKLDNTVGVIDSDYYNNPNNEGHIWVSMTNMSSSDIVNIKKGEAFFQGIIINYQVTNDDSVNTIRTGGMGSTNK